MRGISVLRRCEKCRISHYLSWTDSYRLTALIRWWVEVLHADWTTYMCIWTTAEPRARLSACKTRLSRPQVVYYWPFQGGASVVVYSKCECPLAFSWSLTYCSFYLGYPCGHLLGKCCPVGFSFVLFNFSAVLVVRVPFPFEQHRDKTNKMACAPSEDSDQPEHPPSLIRVFAVRLLSWGGSYGER